MVLDETIPSPLSQCTHGAEVICACGLRVGQLQVRQGCFVRCDAGGSIYVGTTRRADVALAQRIVAAVEASNEGPLQLTDVTAVRETT